MTMILKKYFYLKILQFNDVTFKVTFLGNNIPGPTIFPFVIAVLEIIFCKAVQSPCPGYLKCKRVLSWWRSHDLAISGRTLSEHFFSQTFKDLQSYLKGTHFGSISNIQDAVTRALNSLTENDF